MVMGKKGGVTNHDGLAPGGNPHTAVDRDWISLGQIGWPCIGSTQIKTKMEGGWTLGGKTTRRLGAKRQGACVMEAYFALLHGREYSFASPAKDLSICAATAGEF
ncbi:hypothetical protein GCM10010096_32650 [Alcaligenes pakistanensis]|uniref:Uncharacterized protein n=1 Tax=Alcaligenes pakistanensis TaxID=1482717 RepID=A0A8H9ILX5_9BURK|nr:hypothetical protein GCM10010096_32650 [Alcaligenes pakistanensis]